jgi:cytochrome c biogenesis protein CcmG/thiol:disulfide interchange protein DsbE
VDPHRRASLIRALLLAIVVALTPAALAADPPASIPVAPALTALDPATGAPVAIDPAQGPIHVMFIATWCRPCLAELPKLADLEERWKADGYRLFVVAVPTRQSADRLRELAGQEPVPGKLLFDSGGAVSAAFGAATIPMHALVDRKGRIVARSGVLDPAFHQAVERLVRQEGRVKP